LKALIGSRDICSTNGTRRDRHMGCLPSERNFTWADGTTKMRPVSTREYKCAAANAQLGRRKLILECHKCNRLFDQYFGAVRYRGS
jgi:hypothetical protein